ncbi:MAG: hypothetical protein KC506_02550 [Nanoarchaeota archaeon]|nr:hypothetical protein [Nanoarchaeota archaeon]
MISQKERTYGEYIVMLPDSTMQVSGWADIKPFGRVMAFSEEHAVSAYVMKHSPTTGRLILNNLSRDGGLERYAVEVPRFGDNYVSEDGSPKFGKSVTGHDKSLVTPLGLAEILAEKSGRDSPNKEDYDRAQYLLEKSRVA